MTEEIPALFIDPLAARKKLERMRWPNGRMCPHCRILNRSTALRGNATRVGLCRCNACGKNFSVTLGTAIESSKVPLNLWLYANHLLCRKVDISGHQLSRVLGVTYKTAWFMARRIREALAQIPSSEIYFGGDGQMSANNEDAVLLRILGAPPKPRSEMKRRPHQVDDTARNARKD